MIVIVFCRGLFVSNSPKALFVSDYYFNSFYEFCVNPLDIISYVCRVFIVECLKSLLCEFHIQTHIIQ